MTRSLRAYLPPLLQARRAWGFAINLYALRSNRNWGIGDFSDLCTFVRFAAGAGADVVGVGPLHALQLDAPEDASPYAPSSRYFLNPLYIDVTALREFNADEPAAAALRARVASEPFSETLAALRSAPSIAYAGVARAKFSVLAACYDIFRTAPAGAHAAFEKFVEQHGERLERFALYQALAEHFCRADAGATTWSAWPGAFQRRDSDEVRAFAAQSRRRIDYFKYVQWVAHDQLSAAANQATALALGLYLDMAVGADLGGADVWSDRQAYRLDEMIGAPPDALGPLGQNWGLPAPDERTILRDGAADFAALLRANMAHAGVLRLDHAMSLLRLFRIPRGKPPTQGAYVAYPFEELLDVVATESRRAQCVIVGEDLGNVPAGFRERLAREGIFSYRLLLFERDDTGRFKTPATYPALALATATTHDLPTLPGWALGCDLTMRQRIGIAAAGATSAARDQRTVDVRFLIDALCAHGELDENDAAAIRHSLDGPRPQAAALAPLVHAAYRYLADGRARLILVQLDDILGEIEQINVPGTHGEYPNWRRKNARDLAAITTDARIAELARDLARRVRN